MVNPVIATVPCKDCGQTATVQQVSRGKGKRLMFYTQCQQCGCDQRTGKTIQDYIFNHASARPGYADIFEGQTPPGIKLQEELKAGQETENIDINKNNGLSGQDGQKKGSKAGFIVLGLIVTGVMAVVGLKKMSEFDYLIHEGHTVSKEAKEQSEFIEKPDPAKEVNQDKEAEKTATNLLIGVDAGIRYFWPYVQVPDPVYEQGVTKLIPVARKYGGGELPGWLLFLKQYQDEFLAGVWCAGFAMEVKGQIQAENARVKAEQENKKQDSEIEGEPRAEK